LHAGERDFLLVWSFITKVTDIIIAPTIIEKIYSRLLIEHSEMTQRLQDKVQRCVEDSLALSDFLNMK